MLACKLEGFQIFQLNLVAPDLLGCSTKVAPDSADLENIPKWYHDFADVSSKAKANTLAPHWPYDLKIMLEDGAKVPQPPLYSLLTLELETLWTFLDEHLNMGFIRASQSSHGTLILFIHNKDGLLWLCVC